MNNNPYTFSMPKTLCENQTVWMCRSNLLCWLQTGEQHCLLPHRRSRPPIYLHCVSWRRRQGYWHTLWHVDNRQLYRWSGNGWMDRNRWNRNETVVACFTSLCKRKLCHTWMCRKKNNTIHVINQLCKCRTATLSYTMCYTRIGCHMCLPICPYHWPMPPLAVP